MHAEHRYKHNVEFVRRLIERKPELAEKYAHLLRPIDEVPESELELAPGAEATPAIDRLIALETIVSHERPVLFVTNDRLDTEQVTIYGAEARELVDRMKNADAWLQSIMPLVGRIDVSNFPGEYVGTGWFVANDIVVTNRHVASLIAENDGRRFVFKQGVGNRRITSSVNTTHEFEDTNSDASRIFAVKEVLYIERDSDPHDIAFLKVKRTVDGNTKPFITVASTDIGPEKRVCVIGYPARASRRVIPDQKLMNELYLGRFDVKRAAPGYTMATAEGTSRHDCTTLGGNSGSVVIDLDTQKAVGLHFAGLYEETNFAVRASVLTDYINRKRWAQPFVVTPPAKPKMPTAPENAAQQAVPPAQINVNAAGGEVSVTIPLTLSLRLGTPVLGAPLLGATPGAAGTTGTTQPLPVDPQKAEAVAAAFWRARPEGVIGVRVGYFDEADAIGDTVCLAASVFPRRLAEVEAAGPKEFDGVPVRYLPADADEQVDAMPGIESVDSIAYDDDARTSEEFSFDPVSETMDLILHVGPEYSWDTLKEFLGETQERLVSAMYEFHAVSIKDAIEDQLKKERELTLVLDNATFIDPKNKQQEINAQQVFDQWANRFEFQRIVAPEGLSGLISDSYHMKVTVRDNDTFWLSSGNWKMSSSQPVITDDDRDNATTTDLPGNREWHVVVTNKTLADRFRAHILQDFQHSQNLGGGPLPKSRRNETVLVDIPIQEAIELERRPPSSLVDVVRINGQKTKVQMLLTPDQEGAVYSEAVLELIRSARKSLLFQIPYISMRSNPKQYRGYLDDLIDALVEKLTTLKDARVILRSGGKAFSSPTHAAWFFKSKGVDIDERLRAIEDHHTKGMIVDGKRVLIGSHNWSKPGVTLNRDASLIFDSADVAGYYAQAFNIDWERANPIKARKFVKPKKETIREAIGDVPPSGYQRVPLSDVIGDD
jgi:hypothetical protein